MGDGGGMKNRRSICPQPLLTKALAGVIHAVADQIHPSVFQRIVRDVAAEHGRLATSQYRLTYGVTKQCRHPTHPKCLQTIAEQCGWRLHVTAELDVLRIAILEGELTESHGSGSYLCELALGIFGGAAAELFDYAKVCVGQCSKTPPVGCRFTIYLQESEENLGIPGVVHPPTTNGLVLLGRGRPEDAPAQRLTNRELQVLRLIAQGLSDRKIAAALRISVRTVENHSARIREKLCVDSRTGLVRFAFRARLVEL